MRNKISTFFKSLRDINRYDIVIQTTIFIMTCLAIITQFFFYIKIMIGFLGIALMNDLRTDRANKLSFISTFASVQTYAYTIQLLTFGTIFIQATDIRTVTVVATGVNGLILLPLFCWFTVRQAIKNEKLDNDRETIVLRLVGSCGQLTVGILSTILALYFKIKISKLWCVPGLIPLALIKPITAMLLKPKVIISSSEDE